MRNIALEQNRTSSNRCLPQLHVHRRLFLGQLAGATDRRLQAVAPSSEALLRTRPRSFMSDLSSSTREDSRAARP